jgi:hypothetical protein
MRSGSNTLRWSSMSARMITSDVGAQDAPCTATISWSVVHSLPFPFVPYPLRHTVSCITEYYHGRLVPWNIHLSDEVLTELCPHTHIGHVRLFWLGCYHRLQLLYAPGTALPLGFFLLIADNVVLPRWGLPVLEDTSLKSPSSIGFVGFLAPCGGLPEL